MREKLAKLHNTLSLVETKGESTKIMAQCLQFIEQMAAEIDAEERRKAEEDRKKGEKAAE